MQDVEGSHWQSLQLLLLCRGRPGPLRSLCGYRLRSIWPQPHGMVGPDSFVPCLLAVTASTEDVVGILEIVAKAFVEAQVLLCIAHGTARQIQSPNCMWTPCGMFSFTSTIMRIADLLNWNFPPMSLVSLSAGCGNDKNLTVAQSVHSPCHACRDAMTVVFIFAACTAQGQLPSDIH